MAACVRLSRNADIRVLCSVGPNHCVLAPISASRRNPPGAVPWSRRTRMPVDRIASCEAADTQNSGRLPGVVYSNHASGPPRWLCTAPSAVVQLCSITAPNVRRSDPASGVIVRLAPDPYRACSRSASSDTIDGLEGGADRKHQQALAYFGVNLRDGAIAGCSFDNFFRVEPSICAGQNRTGPNSDDECSPVPVIFLANRVLAGC